MKPVPTVALIALGASVAPVLAQQGFTPPPPVERRVLAERICRDGATTTVVMSGDLIMVEYFSAPQPDGTVAGYEDAYDVKQAQEAKAQFDALRCPEDAPARRAVTR